MTSRDRIQRARKQLVCILIERDDSGNLEPGPSIVGQTHLSRVLLFQNQGTVWGPTAVRSSLMRRLLICVSARASLVAHLGPERTARYCFVHEIMRSPLAMLQHWYASTSPP